MASERVAGRQPGRSRSGETETSRLATTVAKPKLGAAEKGRVALASDLRPGETAREDVNPRAQPRQSCPTTRTVIQSPVK